MSNQNSAYLQQFGLGGPQNVSLYSAKQMLREREAWLEKQLASVPDWTKELAEIKVMLRGADDPV